MANRAFLTLAHSGDPNASYFEALLIECVSAFENDEPRLWAGVLQQASIELDVPAEELSFDVEAVPHLLRGYKWLRPVPWAE